MAGARPSERKQVFIDRLLTADPNAASLFGGKPPDSYAAVAKTFETLIRRYGEVSEAGGVEQDAIKMVLRRLGAHLNPFARREVRSDISADDFFARLKHAAGSMMKLMTTGQHAKAVELGLARKLALPKDLKKKVIKQDKFVPFLTSKFKKKVLGPLLASDNFSRLDADEAVVVAMLVHGEYIDRMLKDEPGISELIGNFRTVPNKDLMRVLVKLLGDYADERNPHAFLLDIVRRSVTAPLEDQEAFIAGLSKLGPSKKLKKFVKVRAKETLTDPEADIKFVNVGLAYTPTTGPMAQEVAVTFGVMVADPGFGAMMDAVQKRNPHISDLMMELAGELLGHKSIAKEPVTMLIEVQMYHPEFLRTKKQLHGLYKFERPENLVDLTKDLAKFATNPAMAYKAEVGGLNEAARLRILRDFRDKFAGSQWPPLPSSSGELALGNSERLQAAIKKRGAAETLGTLMSYCDAIEVKRLM